jgi:Ser/Thr protein kinase RdoA (MazF antagonist)
MPSVNDHPHQEDVFTVESPSFSTEQVKVIADRQYGIKGDLFALPSERDQNFRIDTETGDRFVIKIANRAEDPTILDMQNKAMEHISNIDPDLPIPKVLLSLEGLAIDNILAEDGANHAMRVLTYLPGSRPKENPTDHALLRPMGTCLARLVLALRGFFHPIANYDLLWDLKHTSKLREYLPYITNEKSLELVSYFLDRFDQNVFPLLPKLRAQIVHNDIVPYNILVAEDDPGRIVGILDFGDLIYTPLVIDLATTIAPTIVDHDDPVGAAAEIVAAYNEIIPIEEIELRILYDLIAARLTMLYVIAAWRSEIHPYNREYIAGDIDDYLSMLVKWRGSDFDSRCVEKVT